MLPSLCRAMAANQFVSRFRGPSGGGRGRRRFALGFRAASWQHRYLDCGTLNLSSAAVTAPRSRCRQAATGKEPPVACACTVGEVLG
jgi:hypothetical protein